METLKNFKLKAQAGSAYNFGWQIMKEHFMTLFLLILMMGVIAIPYSLLSNHENHNAALVILQGFATMYALFILQPFRYGAKYLYLKAVRLQKVDVKELFDIFNNYLNIVLAALLAGAIIGIGFVFLIIPGIVFACRLAFVPYLVMDKKYDPIKSVEESWRLTRGYGWRIFWMSIVAFFIFIAGFIALVFGAFIASIWVKASFAALYQAVLVEKGEYTEDAESAKVENEKSESHDSVSKSDSAENETNSSDNQEPETI